MEFAFDLATSLGAPAEHQGPFVGCVDERRLRSGAGRVLSTVLEELGRRSAMAQGLRKPVTYGSGLGDNRVYLMVDGRMALGFLKVGTKRLFVTSQKAATSAFADVQGAFVEIDPLCALDFYIHEKCQRRGLGHELFEAMLFEERAQAAQLAYDRPSPKLLGFLGRHYGLHRYQPQNNNFVVFEDYFAQGSQAARSARRPASRGGDAVAANGRHELPAKELHWNSAAAALAADALPTDSGLCPAARRHDAESRSLFPTGVKVGLGRGGPGPVRDLFGSAPLRQRVCGAVGSCR